MTGHGTSSQNAKKGVNVTFVITNLHLPTLPIINSTSAAPTVLKKTAKKCRALRDTIRDARLRGICVVAAIADNAANFQSVQLVECALLRCSAHTIQLVAKDVMPFFQQVVTFALSQAEHLHLPQPNDTRWNSTFKMLRALSRLRDAVDDKVALVSNDIAVELLKPTADATDLVQKDDGNTFDAIIALQLLLTSASKQTEFGRVVKKFNLETQRPVVHSTSRACCIFLSNYKKARIRTIRV